MTKNVVAYLFGPPCILDDWQPNELQTWLDRLPHVTTEFQLLDE